MVSFCSTDFIVLMSLCVLLCTDDQPSRYRARETAPARARRTIIKAYSRTTKQDPRGGGGPPPEPTVTADIPTAHRSSPKSSIERYFATFKRWVENYKLHIFYLTMFFLVTGAIFVERAYCELAVHFVYVTYLYALCCRLFCGERTCWIASYCWLWCNCYSWCCILYDVGLLCFVVDHGTKLHHLPERDPLPTVRPLRCRRVLPQDHCPHGSVLHYHALHWSRYQFLPHFHSDSQRSELPVP